MSVQDVRIVELIRWEKPLDISSAVPNSKDYQAITYYDKIRVHGVNVDQKSTPLQAAYRVIEQIPSHDESLNYGFRQLIVGITDVEESELDSFQSFWSTQESPLFFVSLVNISLNVELQDEIKRIKAELTGIDYRLYLTYEYDEILIFAKSSSIRAYAECMMKIGFQKNNIGVLDTFTVCCFGEGFEECDDEQVIICAQLGIKNHEKAMEYLVRSGVRENDIHWVLGRSDVGFLIVESSLPWIHKFYQENRMQNREEKEISWLSTTQFSVMVQHTNQKDLMENLAGQPPKAPWSRVSEQWVREIFPLYKDKCKELHIRADSVFERVLYETGRLVDNALENRLSQDLAVCILPELIDFLQYLKCTLSSQAMKEKDTALLRRSLNSFYLNVLTLVNSTVHSNQEFVLIPHSAAPSFEMPPKVIAYYGLIVRKIIEAFKDDNRIYGVMLAPKLVDDLEVESFSTTELEEVGHLLSVGIGEPFLYNLLDTVMTLGHEMAHFVGESTRQREYRRQLVYSFYLYRLISQLCEFCLHSLPGCAEAELRGLVDSEAILRTAERLAQGLNARNSSMRPLMRELTDDLYDLARSTLYDPEYKDYILNEIILPMFERQEFQTYLAQHLHTVLVPFEVQNAEIYLRVRAERIYEMATRNCLENWSLSFDANEFSEYIGYLFTESYADLAMVLLFDMSLEEYIHIFSKGMGESDYHSNTAEDVIEMMRFISVIRSMAQVKDDWNTNVTVENESKMWDDVLKKIAIPACKWDILDFCQENQIEIALLTCLVKYLVKCAKTLKNHFAEESQEAALQMLHELKHEIETQGTILSRIDKIRKQEKELLNQFVLS